MPKYGLIIRKWNKNKLQNIETLLIFDTIEDAKEYRNKYNQLVSIDNILNIRHFKEISILSNPIIIDEDKNKYSYLYDLSKNVYKQNMSELLNIQNEFIGLIKDIKAKRVIN
jgi:mannose/fructose/N-acetylgalactosamine-specific phosphotransferase system component IIB